MNPVNASANKAAAAVASAALLVGGSLLAYLGLAIILALVGYDISAWRGALVMLALLLVLTACAMFAVSAVIRSRLRRAREAERLRAADASSHIGAAESSAEQNWTAPVVLAVVAAAAVGPIRAVRLGLRAYSLWTTVRSLTAQTGK